MSLESPFGSDGQHGAIGLVAPYDIREVVGIGPALTAPAITGFGQDVPKTEVAGKAWSRLLSWLGVPNIADVIGLVLGLLLVAAGIFLFKPVREVATAAVKTAVVAA